jgi:hypothetical protein
MGNLQELNESGQGSEEHVFACFVLKVYMRIALETALII